MEDMDLGDIQDTLQLMVGWIGRIQPPQLERLESTSLKKLSGDIFHGSEDIPFKYEICDRLIDRNDIQNTFGALIEWFKQLIEKTKVRSIVYGPPEDHRLIANCDDIVKIPAFTNLIGYHEF